MKDFTKRYKLPTDPTDPPTGGPDKPDTTTKPIRYK